MLWEGITGNRYGHACSSAMPDITTTHDTLSFPIYTTTPNLSQRCSLMSVTGWGNSMYNNEQLWSEEVSVRVRASRILKYAFYAIYTGVQKDFYQKPQHSYFL